MIQGFLEGAGTALVVLMALGFMAILGMGIAASLLRPLEKLAFAPAFLLNIAIYAFIAVAAVAAFRPGTSDMLVVLTLGLLTGVILYSLKCARKEDWEQFKNRIVIR
jgi:hypothetical protein